LSSWFIIKTVWHRTSVFILRVNSFVWSKGIQLIPVPSVTKITLICLSIFFWAVEAVRIDVNTSYTETVLIDEEAKLVKSSIVIAEELILVIKLA